MPPLSGTSPTDASRPASYRKIMRSRIALSSASFVAKWYIRPGLETPAARAAESRVKVPSAPRWASAASSIASRADRSEEHTSELQSRGHLVCRLLLEKKNKDDGDRHECTSDEGGAVLVART